MDMCFGFLANTIYFRSWAISFARSLTSPPASPPILPEKRARLRNVYLNVFPRLLKKMSYLKCPNSQIGLLKLTLRLQHLVICCCDNFGPHCNLDCELLYICEHEWFSSSCFKTNFNIKCVPLQCNRTVPKSRPFLL